MLAALERGEEVDVAAAVTEGANLLGTLSGGFGCDVPGGLFDRVYRATMAISVAATGER